MRRNLLLLGVCLMTVCCYAQDKAGREYIDVNAGWNFRFAYDVRRNAPEEKVSLPHTWNASDPFKGSIDYRRTMGVYSRGITTDPSWKNKRVFLYFEGANSVADVLVNNTFVTQHKGGYTAFCAEITPYLKPGGENKLLVQVSNAARMDVLPLAGDFNIYGGLHRQVWLIVANENCITPLDYASPGVYISQDEVSSSKARISVATKLSLTGKGTGISLRTIVRDARQKEVMTAQSTVDPRDTLVTQHLTITRPHLWEGKKDPYLYEVAVQLLQDDNVIDEVKQPLGLRYFKVDADSGFVLNGRYMDLYGFGYHEDVEGSGSALSREDLESDMALVLESGATAMRLTHYPHASYFYDLADKNGIVLWTEIPLVGPGGYTGTGYANDPSLQQQARQQLVEMIRQYYNHPSIFFWGLFNELKLDYDNPLPFLSRLNELAKKEDPSRITTCATFLDTDTFNHVSDVIAWNKYYGWYGGQFSDIGAWADDMHDKFPRKPIGVSEYGAGANIDHHIEQLKAPIPDGDFHAEEWQTAFHEAHWEEFGRRRFIWSKFIWALRDFGSSIREEGGFQGINDKGLVTYDRRVKKDAFYFYKANWNTTPMLYLTEKRNNDRSKSKTDIKAYTNLPAAALFVNGKPAGEAKKDALGRLLWKDITLKPGNNLLVVKATYAGMTLSDSCRWNLKSGEISFMK
ncbi:glycoside hydrolase family 2 TIM barrel-domain containing protein [Chitinophaga sp. MM2321]|uniref:glycoside hydrolase family 2 protein n=1 Tax=Chitinophaga sp. MM2321 TaxID=3137178 RepID=UPI0032D5AFCB